MTLALPVSNKYRINQFLSRKSPLPIVWLHWLTLVWHTTPWGVCAVKYDSEGWSSHSFVTTLVLCFMIPVPTRNHLHTEKCLTILPRWKKTFLLVITYECILPFSLQGPLFFLQTIKSSTICQVSRVFNYETKAWCVWHLYKVFALDG